MSNWSLEMIDIRRIIHLREEGKSERKVEKIVGVSRDRVSHYYAIFRESGFSVAEISELTDEDLSELFVSTLVKKQDRFQRLESTFEYMEKELKKKGVTRELLWLEYSVKEEEAGFKAYSLSQFYHHFSEWRKKINVSMRLEHKVGDKLFVDFTGGKLPLYSRERGEKIRDLECFVVILPASQLIYT